LALLFSAIFFLASTVSARAQETGDAPLGDVARSFRKKPASPEAVIDNDNLTKVVDDAESHRAAGTPVFSLEAGGKSFHVSSPDVTCSLSFSAKTTSLLSDPLLLDELPRAELDKLDGPATIDGDSFEVSLRNGTAWELREVTIGLTIVRRAEAREIASSIGQARIVPAAAGNLPEGQEPSQKRPDVTLLLRVKGSAPPGATAIFRTSLNFVLFSDQEWHWAIVKAKGISASSSMAAIAHPESHPGDLAFPMTHADAVEFSSPATALVAPSPLNSDAASH
jgi:hypothetical protein